MKAGQLSSLPVNYSCLSSVPSLAVYIINNAVNKSSFSVWQRSSSWYKFLLEIHSIYHQGCSRTFAAIFQIPSFSPSFFFFLWETGATDLAIPLNSLSRSPSSSIRRTKTKCSMGYNSVRLVLVEDYRLYTSVSLWCHCGMLYWHTHIHTPRLQNKELYGHENT